MQPYADVEIGLHRWNARNYAVELRYRQPDDANERVPVRGYVWFDFSGLEVQRLDSVAYGRLLTQNLFSDAAIHEHFGQMRAAAQANDSDLRVRLFVGPSAPEL